MIVDKRIHQGTVESLGFAEQTRDFQCFLHANDVSEWGDEKGARRRDREETLSAFLDRLLFFEQGEFGFDKNTVKELIKDLHRRD